MITKPADFSFGDGKRLSDYSSAPTRRSHVAPANSPDFSQLSDMSLLIFEFRKLSGRKEYFEVN